MAVNRGLISITLPEDYPFPLEDVRMSAQMKAQSMGGRLTDDVVEIHTDVLEDGTRMATYVFRMAPHAGQ